MQESPEVVRAGRILGQGEYVVGDTHQDVSLGLVIALDDVGRHERRSLGEGSQSERVESDDIGKVLAEEMASHSTRPCLEVAVR
jgi:hypothetical protein